MKVDSLVDRLNHLPGVIVHLYSMLLLRATTDEAMPKVLLVFLYNFVVVDEGIRKYASVVSYFLHTVLDLLALVTINGNASTRTECRRAVLSHASVFFGVAVCLTKSCTSGSNLAARMPESDIPCLR
jgi:hypothetical protein